VASTLTQFGDGSEGRSVVSPMAQRVAVPKPTAAPPLVEPGVDRRLHSVWVDIIDTTELKFGRRLGEHFASRLSDSAQQQRLRVQSSASVSSNTPAGAVRSSCSCRGLVQIAVSLVHASPYPDYV